MRRVERSERDRFMIFYLKMKFCYSLLFLLLLLFITTPTATWMLSQLGLNETYRVRHISMHFGRVFLSISIESNSFPTLIESRWPNQYVALRSIIFPNADAHDIGTEKRNCRQIQRSIWSQVDSWNRLWVMDIGFQNSIKTNSNDTKSQQICFPKLLVFDLLRNNAEVLRIDCSKYIKPNPNDLLSIKLGPPSKSPCRIVEKFVYFLLAGDSHIFAYDIIEQRWHQRLLIGRKYAQMLPEMLSIRPNDMAFGQRNELLISDVDGFLFRTSNALLRHEKIQNISHNYVIEKFDMITIDPSGSTRPTDLIGHLTLEHLGSFLGQSHGMMVDLKNVLYYVVPKYGAVVRCPEYWKNLTAEGNEIIYMTSKNIQQIFFGSEDSVWLVTDRELKPNDHCFAGRST